MLKLTDVTQALPRMKTGTDLTDVLEEPADPELHQQLQALRVFVSSFDEIQTCMLSHTNPASLIQSLDTIATVILLVQQRISPSSI